MKKLVTSYTFDASAQTIAAVDFTSFEKILLVTNVTDNIIIYNFSSPSLGGTHTGTTLTLTYDTTSMADTDKLQIFVEDGAATQAVTQSGTWDEVGINDSGNSITVDATNLDVRDLTNTDVVTAELSAVDNAVLDTIAAKDFATQTTLAAVNAKLVSGTDIGDVTINNSTGAAAVNIQDGGNTITVDGTVAVTSAGITTIAGAVAGTEMQVDVLTMPTTTVQATNLDVRDLVAASDSVTVHGDVGAIDQLDLTNSNPVTVAIVDSSGDQISSFGGGTQYTEDAAAAANPVGTAINLIRADTLAGVTTTDGDNLAARGTDKGELYVKHVDSIPVTDNSSSLTVDNAGLTELAAAINGSSQMDVNIAASNATITVASHAVTNAGTFAVQVDGNALTSLQLADDVVATLGTTTYTEASTKGTTIGAVRRDADTTLVDTTNEIGPLQMNAAGQLKVEVFSGEALPVTLTSTTVTGTVAVTQSGTWDEVGINDSGNSITVDGTVAVTNGGTFVTQENGALLTSAQLIDDVVYTDDTSTHATGTSKGVGIMATATPTDTSVNANDIGMVAMTTDRRLLVDASGVAVPVTDNSSSLTVDYATTGSGNATGALRVELANNGTGVLATVGAVTAITNALPAGTNAIGKLAANSGVDIGDVDVTSVGGTVTTKGIPSDIDINGSNANHADKYYTNAGAVTDGIVWSPAAGKRWHVLTLYINVSAAATVTLEDDLAGGDVARWKGELAANSGVVLTYDKEHPFCSGEDAADLIITTTAGNVYVQAVGYEV